MGDFPLGMMGNEHLMVVVVANCDVVYLHVLYVQYISTNSRLMELITYYWSIAVVVDDDDEGPLLYTPWSASSRSVAFGKLIVSPRLIHSSTIQVATKNKSRFSFVFLFFNFVFIFSYSCRNSPRLFRS